MRKVTTRLEGAMQRPDPAFRLRILPGASERQVAPAFPLEEMRSKLTFGAQRLAERKEPLTWAALTAWFQVKHVEPPALPRYAQITAGCLRWLVWDQLRLTLDEVREAWHGRALPERRESAPKVEVKTEGGLPRLPRRFVALDVETTGTTNDDRVWEVALVAFDEGEARPIHKFVKRFNPERRMTARASEITGVTNRDLVDYPVWERKHARYIARYLSSAPAIVGHNLSFDRRMLAAELEAFGFCWPEEVLAIDTLKVGRVLKKAGVVDAPRLRLNVLCQHLGVPFDDDQHHGAYYDALKAGQIARRLDELVEQWESAGQRQLGQRPPKPVNGNRDVAEAIKLLASSGDIDATSAPEMGRWAEEVLAATGLPAPWVHAVSHGSVQLLWRDGLSVILRPGGEVTAHQPPDHPWRCQWRDEATVKGFSEWLSAVRPVMAAEAREVV